jgi:tripartite-type tricarboxylate transporter receptor subunit TctC
MLAFVALAIAVMPSPAATQPAEEFYRGKTVTMLIGYPPAGANDVYARLVARHIGRHIPGQPNVVARNMPGAGSLAAANHIFNVAPKDGTVLGLLVPTLPLEEKLGSTAAKYTASGFHWIGRMAPAPNITFINANARVKTIQDAFQQEAVLGATGRSATNAVYPTVLNNVLGTKFKIVIGYKGSADTMLAMERGEVEGHSATYDTLKTVHPDWITDKKVNIVVQYSLQRHPELPDVPTSSELAKLPEQRQILRAVSSAAEIGKFVLTAPGVPADRITVLRRAFDAMTADPDYIADAKKLRIELHPLTGAELQKIVAEVDNLTPDIVAKIKAIYPMN